MSSDSHQDCPPSILFPYETWVRVLSFLTSNNDLLSCMCTNSTLKSIAQIYLYRHLRIFTLSDLDLLLSMIARRADVNNTYGAYVHSLNLDALMTHLARSALDTIADHCSNLKVFIPPTPFRGPPSDFWGILRLAYQFTEVDFLRLANLNQFIWALDPSTLPPQHLSNPYPFSLGAVPPSVVKTLEMSGRYEESDIALFVRLAPEFTNLQSLLYEIDFHGDPTADDKLITIAKICAKTLTELSLRGWAATENVDELCKICVNLEILRLQEIGWMTRESARIIVISELPPKLTTLEMENIELVGDVTVEAIKARGDSIKSFHVKNCLWFRGGLAVAIIDHLDNLRYFTIVSEWSLKRQCVVGHLVFHAIARLSPQLVQLKIFDHRGENAINNLYLEKILRSCGRSLKYLDVTGCQNLQWGSIRVIGKYCKDLRVLLMSDCLSFSLDDFYDLEARSLISIAEFFPRLQYLDLRSQTSSLADPQTISEEVISIFLAKMPHLKGLHLFDGISRKIDARKWYGISKEMRRRMERLMENMAAVDGRGKWTLYGSRFRPMF